MEIFKKLKERLQNFFINVEGIKILLAEAKAFEEKNKYEDACYSYACAIGQGEKDKKYKGKINYLFNSYGPFTFEKQLERMKKEYCSCCDSCGEGYHVGIIGIIEKIIDRKLTKQST